LSADRFNMRALTAGRTVMALVAAVAIAAVGLAVAHAASSPTDDNAKTAQLSASPNCVPAKLNVSAALAGGQVTVSPGPETRDASPTTQISLLGAPAGELSNVNVKGSRSGAHAGRLLAYSQGDGASFVPSKPFSPGESVSVSADLISAGKTTPFAWSFVVSVPDTTTNSSSSASTTPTPPPREYESFHSRPSLRPPDVTVSSEDNTATGDMFLAPYSGIGQYGPMILNEHGELIWFDPIPAGARAADLRVQSYEGKPVLTWWQDPLVAGGSKTAGVVIANSSYQDIAVVRAGNGYQPDLHEFTITPQGTALITVYAAIDCDTSAVGGTRDGAVADTLLQEIDLKTGLVMYEWHSLDHVSLQSTYVSAAPTGRSEPLDYFHINSIDVAQNGDLLVDSRNTWALYDISSKSGQVQWQLGGKHSSFKLGPGVATAWQHDARQQPDGAITFFDNGAFPQVHRQSRAIEVALDPANMTASLVRSYEHENPLVAGSQGNVQSLPGGDWMVGWGQAGYLSEIDASGRVLFNAHLPPDWESYRTYIFPWSGHPPQAPAVAVVPSPSGGGAASVYVSWNGATEVSSWRVLVGASVSSLAPLSTAAKSGFETAIALPAHAPRYVQVQALDGAGAVIGASAVVSG
jgi:hypothetical protein